MSPSQNDVGNLKLDSNRLRNQVRQLQMDLQTEQDAVSQLRKLMNTLQKEKLEYTTKNNSEVTGLETQIAKFRSQLEKSEATKQSLEFELTKANRDLVQQKHQVAQRDLEQKDMQDEFNHKIRELKITIEDLERHLQASEKAKTEAENMLEKKLGEKHQEISRCLTEQEKLALERDKFNSLISQQEGAISEMDRKIRNLEMEKQSNTDCLRRNETELEYGKEREERLKKDLETALQRLRTLEEGIEAERAAHLETKFNTEIVQLRLRDMEGAVEVEKSGSSEANKAIERLTKQTRELEETYESERRNGKQLAEKLERVEKEYKLVQRQLSSEVESKKNVIGNLSKEVEIHQKNFNELKDELNKAKKRQIYLEETYGGNMRELELLLQTFSVDERPKKTSRKETPQSPRPSVVLEKLRSTLSEYKKKLDSSSEECSKMKKMSKNLSQEIDQCKELIWSKDKALEETQRNYTRTAKELNRVRSDYGELESVISKLKVDIQSSSTVQNKDRTRIQELSEEEKLAFLHGLYQRLLAGRILVTKDKEFNQFSWVDLTTLVYEQISALVTESQRSEEKQTTSSLTFTSILTVSPIVMDKHKLQYISTLMCRSRNSEACIKNQSSDRTSSYSFRLALCHCTHKYERTSVIFKPCHGQYNTTALSTSGSHCQIGHFVIGSIQMFALSHVSKARNSARDSPRLCLPSQHHEGQIYPLLDLEDDDHQVTPGACRDGVNMDDLQIPRGGYVDTFNAKQQRLYLKHYLNSPVGSVSWQNKMMTHTYLLYQCVDGIFECFSDTSINFCTLHLRIFILYKDLMSALQCHILDFTQRLHSVEVERRTLLVEIGQLRQASHELAPLEEVEKLQDEVEALRIKNHQFVPGNKFDSVCQELNNALQREQQAQELLNEQGRQLEEITMKLAYYSNQEMEKDHTLTETVKGLAETKLEMRRKEQTSRQLNKQIAQLEADKKAQQNNIKDAEKALRTVAKDKEILATYIKTIQGALEKVRKDISISKPGALSEVLSKVLLNPDFIPQDIGKAGPELIACQTLVGTFIDTHQHAVNKIQSLEREMENLKHHVTRVKQELTDAVKREFEQVWKFIPKQDVPDRNGVFTGKEPGITGSNSELDNTQKDTFYPLKEDSEISFCAPKPASPRNRGVLSTSKSNFKSPVFQTPAKSERPYNGRPRNYEPGGQ
ncbi:hypothetical protein ScPMuIL_018753 [Solemya velum]